MRYDALGRRVLVRTRRDNLCRTSTPSTVDCSSGIERYVWAGDNILWEMRGPGADSVAGARLNEISATGQEFGVVGYTHAGGVDRPLVVWKGMGATPDEVVVPHANWRGVFGKGTTSSGATSTLAIVWPGFKTTAYHSMGPSQQATTNWMGSLIGGQRDPGGNMYMRNRYYDPQTGQFTQTDPIGIDGGLNTYGFAAGDPVSFSDPSGLSPVSCAKGTDPTKVLGCWERFGRKLRQQEEEAVPGSNCDIGGCILKRPSGEQRAWVLGVLDRMHTDTPFCEQVQNAGYEMVSRQLLMYDNLVWYEEPRRGFRGSRLWGESPYHIGLGGPVMYLYSGLSGSFAEHVVVHEAVHGVTRRYDLRGQPMFYGDGGRTPLGTIDQTASRCR